MMFMRKLGKSLDLDLRKLILLLIVFCVSTLFFVSLGVSYLIVKNQLISNSLAINSEYANKIALNTDNHFQNILKELKYSAQSLGKDFNNFALREAEVDRLKYQSDHYNSVVIGDAEGRLINFSPNILNIDRNKIQTTPGIQASLKNKKTYISSPYYSVKDNLIVFLSQPIFDKDNHYKGFIGSAIYLKQKNIINHLLTINYSYKKSYMYVIDQNNKIIFHPDTKRIGETVRNNTGLKYMQATKNGNIRLINSRGVDNLAGFSYIPSTKWLIVSQQPTNELLEQASTIIYKVTGGIFLFYLLIFYIVWRFALVISNPLHNLANMASLLNQPKIEERIKRINPWYYEVTKFKLSLLLSARKFSHKLTEMDHRINTDPLTGLLNRRGMQFFTKGMIDSKVPFSVLLIDIDHFKRINDTYGHDEGDEVLKTLAKIMLENFRKNDLCCRHGGEEFIVIIPNVNKQEVYESAERFRHAVETYIINNVGRITVSIGIASWPESSNSFTEVLKIADNNLYHAKNHGRNQVKHS